MKSSARRTLAAGLAVVALTLVVATAGARPPPEPVCVACGVSILGGDAPREPGGSPATAAPGESVPRVERTAATIRIDPGGTGHWTARTTLSGDRELDADRIRRRVRRRLDHHRVADGYRNLSVAIEGRTVVVRFSVPGVAHRGPGGVLVVDYFYWHGDSGRWFELDADRVTVRGPEGWTTVEPPQTGTVRGGTVVWEGDGEESFGPTLPERTYFAFAPDDGPTALGAAKVGIGLDVLDAKRPDLAGLAAFPALVLGAFVALLAAYGGRIRAWAPRRRLAAGAGVAAVLAVASVVGAALLREYGVEGIGPRLSEAAYALLFTGLFSGTLSVLGVGAALSAAYVLAAVVAPRFGVDPVRATVRTALGAVGVGLLVLPVVAGSDAAWTGWFASWVAVLAPVLCFPLGMVAGRNARAHAALGGAVVLSPVAVALGTAPVGGFGSMYFPLSFVPWALVAGVAGTVAFGAGAGVAGDAPTGFEPAEAVLERLLG